MDGMTTGATERIVVDVREAGLNASSGSTTPSADHLRRLCASLEEATRLVSPAGGVSVHEEAPLVCRAYSLDVLAFAIAVDAALFLDEVCEGMPLPSDTRAWLGRTLTSFDRLLHFLDASRQRGPVATGIEGSLRDAGENLGKTAISLRTRLASLCGFRVVAEFRCSEPIDERCSNLRPAVAKGEG